jgi:hypothetical protein
MQRLFGISIASLETSTLEWAWVPLIAQRSDRRLHGLKMADRMEYNVQRPLPNRAFHEQKTRSWRPYVLNHWPQTPESLQINSGT